MAEISNENYEFGRENTKQQFRGSTTDKAMNETSHKRTFQRMDTSYNEQRNAYDYEGASSYDLPPPEKTQWQRYTNTVEVNPTGANMPTIPLGQAEASSPFIRSTDEKIRNLDARSAKMQEKIDQLDAARGDVIKVRKEYHGDGQRISGSKRLINRSEGRHHGKHDTLHVHRKATKQDYDEYLKKQTRHRIKKEITGRLLFRKTTELLRDESVPEDELTEDMKRRTGRFVRGQIYLTRHNVRTLKKYNSVYYRLEFAQNKQQLLALKRQRLQQRKQKEEMKKRIREARSREQKRKLKKAMVQYQRAESGSFIRRTRQNILTGRKKRQYEKQVRKRVSKIVFAASGFFISLMVLLLVIFLIIFSFTYGSSETMGNTMALNDYPTLTEAMAYFNDLETEMDVYLNGDRDALEAELEEEYGPDIDAYIYDLADFGHPAISLMAYLSAKFGIFTLEDVKPEMDSLFAEMYQLSIRTGLVERVSDGQMVKVCYVTLTKKELDDIIDGRISIIAEYIRYAGIKFSGGGQQIFNLIMKEEWTDRISSNFGSRRDPIDGTVRQHNGVDIAVPEGTQLYSACSGTVTTAQYSDSAGYMVTVTDKKGYKVTFMHMKSYIVAVNQTVQAGDFIGLSGNTGNSTGPHLHLAVQTPDGTYSNPILYIPSASALSEETN